MKRTTVILALLAVILAAGAQPAATARPTGAQTAAGGKMSVWVRNAAAHSTSAPRRTADGQPTVMTAFVKTVGQDGRGALQEYGCHTWATLGSISIATIPLNRLEALASHPAVRRIEASPSAHTTLDVVAQVSDITPAYQPTADYGPFTGQGVVVGVMDVGFDLTHPTFFDDASLSRYRIKAFWDQLSPDSLDSGFPVGRDYTNGEEILALGCATDGPTQYHGTHTAGIAAGSGYDSPYRGVAYESDLVLVANAVTQDTIYIQPKDYYKYTSATDALGFKYLFDYALQQGQPCVASFSEGYTPYLDEDDELYGEFLEQLIGPGRILVSSAGNENLNTTYIEKPLGVEEAGAFLWLFKRNGVYRILSDGQPTIRLIAYPQDGSRPEVSLATASDSWTDDVLTDTLFVNADTCAVSLMRYTSALTGGQTMYELTLRGSRAIDSMGAIALVVAGSDCTAKVYGNSTSALKNKQDDTRWNSAQQGHNILAPGCLSAPICVGSTSHRLEFTDMAGKTWPYQETQGLVTSFSSRGPAMNGLLKPDVCAPGLQVISSLSSYYMEANPDDLEGHVAHFQANGRTYPWAAASGTSMSTPVVAGAIALWLQANPQLTRDDIMRVLQRTSRHPEASLTYPNGTYGQGDIDVYLGLLDVLGLTAIREVSRHQPQSATVTARDGQLCLTFGAVPAEPVTIAVYSTAGALMYRTQLTVTQHTVTLPLPLLGRGIYAVQLSGSRNVTGSQLIRI